MNTFPKRTAFATCLFLILCGVGIWLGIRVMDTGTKQPETSAQIKLQPRTEAASKPSPMNHPEEKVPPVALATETGISDGEERISSILSNPNLDFPSAVNRLLELLPGLDERAQEAAANHIANLSDEKSTGQWIPMLVANQLPAPATEVLFNDLLNRPQELAMPVLASIADQPVHPKSKSSIEILETLYGPSPQNIKWSVWVKSKLQESSAVH